jgi:hypothetical protein
MGLVRAFRNLSIFLVRLIPIRGLPKADAPTMSAAQRKLILDRLESSASNFLDRIDQLSDAQWKWKPAPDRWSTAEVAEHVTITERLLLHKVQEALGNPVQPDWRRKTAGKTQFLLRVVAPRRGRARAPKEVSPAAGWSMQETVRRFREVRAATVSFTLETDADMNACIARHPFPVFGDMSAFQWLLYIPTHLERHMRQIDEIRSEWEHCSHAASASH